MGLTYTVHAVSCTPKMKAGKKSPTIHFPLDFISQTFENLPKEISLAVGLGTASFRTAYFAGKLLNLPPRLHFPPTCA